MALILSIETSTKTCSVALSKDDNILSIKEVTGDYSHSENIGIFTEEVLKKANKTYDNLDAVAISKGPGSYTGLRIGTSFAKGLCFGLKIPLISVETLDAMALLAKEIPSDYYIPMIDARRMEVYCAIYTSEGKKITETEAKIIDNQSFLELNGKVLVFGDGVEKTKEVLTNDKFQIIDTIFPSAKSIALIAFQKYNIESFENTAYFEPYYLKDFIAGKPKKLV